MEKQSSNSSKESSVEKEQEIISKPEVEPEEVESELNEEEMTAVVDQDTGNSEETHFKVVNGIEFFERKFPISGQPNNSH